MASTVRTMTLTVGMISVPVALRTASERKLPGFSTASPSGNKYKRTVKVSAPPVEPAPKTRAKAKPVEAPAPVATLSDLGEPEYAFVDEVTGEIFDESEIKTGVWEGDVFVAVDKSAIEQIDELTRVEDIEIDHFVPLDQVPWERVIGSYYLAPNKGVGLKALALVRDALEATGKAGVFRLMPKSRVHPAVVYVKNDGLMVSLLAYAEEYKQVYEGAAALARAEDRSPEMIELAVKLIETLSVSDSTMLDAMSDEQADRKIELIEKSREGAEVVLPAKRQRAASVSDLERALRESVAEAQKAKRPAARKVKTAK